MKKPTFISTENGVKNVSRASSVIHEDGFTLALDPSSNVVCFEKDDGESILFERLKNVIKPVSNSSIVLDNGSFIDPTIIAEIFLSPKTGHLLITGLNNKLLCMFKSDDFSNLDELLQELSNNLVAVSEGHAMTAIQWVDFK